jgi:hypothetical protein
MSTFISRGLEHPTQQDRRALRWAWRAIAVAGVVVTGAQGATAQSVTARCGERSYAFQTIDPPFGTPGVDMAVTVLWMNNWGEVSAQYQMPPDPDWFANLHGAVRRQGMWTNVDVPGAASSAGVLNNRGALLLDYQMPGEPWRAAIRDRQGMHPFPDLAEYPGGLLGNGINDRGQIAAVAIDAAGGWHGFVGSRTSHTIVDFPEAIATIPMWLNDFGVVVGWHSLADGSGHGFRYVGGKFVAIDRPGASATFLTAINNWGVITGNFNTAAGEFRGFLLERGRYTDIAFPGATFTNLYSINDLGQLAGTYCDAAGICHGFVATPVHGE